MEFTGPLTRFSSGGPSGARPARGPQHAPTAAHAPLSASPKGRKCQTTVAARRTKSFHDGITGAWSSCGRGRLVKAQPARRAGHASRKSHPLQPRLHSATPSQTTSPPQQVYLGLPGNGHRLAPPRLRSAPQRLAPAGRSSRWRPLVEGLLPPGHAREEPKDLPLASSM